MAGYVYITTNRRMGVLYVGVTSDLAKRVYEHKHDLVPGFTSRYRLHRLVYYEVHDEITAAIKREKQIKRWRRAWKVSLIETGNLDWHDLYDGLFGGGTGEVPALPRLKAGVGRDDEGVAVDRG